ncbi:phosphoglycerate kinase [Myxococcota bacterium]|nr:phosphoglycerate kinase [Myxococcota bacterium]
MSKSPRKSALPLLDGLELAGKRVLIRADLDSPLADGKLVDDARIRAAVPTIRYAHEHGARVIVAAHAGRPRGHEAGLSILTAGDALAGLLKCEILLADDPVGDGPTKLCRDLRDGQIMMLENLRFHEGEDRNDDTFARQLAALCDVYVNDAFAACAKPQASTLGITAYVKPRVAGFRLADEVDALNRLLLAPKSDFVAIVGGARFSEQLALIERMLPRVETLVLAGAVGLTALAAQGRRVGQSRIETAHLRAAAELLTQATRKGIEVLLPVDHLAVERFERAAPVVTVPAVDVPEGLAAVDLGPETVARLIPRLKSARTLLWHGPVGVAEWPQAARGSLELARAAASGSAYTVAFGPETGRVLAEAGVFARFGHVSTGDAATFEYLEGRELPGLTPLGWKRSH